MAIAGASERDTENSGGLGLQIGSDAYKRMTTNGGRVDPEHKRHTEAEIEDDARDAWVSDEPERREARNEENMSGTPDATHRNVNQYVRDSADAKKMAKAARSAAKAGGLNLHLDVLEAAVDDPTVTVDEIDDDSLLGRASSRRSHFGM